MLVQETETLISSVYSKLYCAIIILLSDFWYFTAYLRMNIAVQSVGAFLNYVKTESFAVIRKFISEVN